MAKRLSGNLVGGSGSGGGNIQDLDDFKLNDSGATSSITRTPDTLTWNIGSGGVGYGELNYGATYWSYGPEGYNASNILTYLRDTATLPIDVDINGVTVTITAVEVFPSGNTNNLRLRHSGFTNTNNISGNTDWVLSLVNTPSEPLANGDILQYVSAESKFKPAQLPISSVNTQTGAVSLGVEDLDDFALNPNSGSITWGTYQSSAGVTIDGVYYPASNTPVPEKWHANSNFIYVNRRSDGLIDRTDQLKALSVGDSITITDSVGYSVTDTITVISTDFVADGGQYDRVLIKFGSISTFDSTVNKTGSLTIAASEFAVGTAPLADGDILQYVSADSKFKPAQASGVRSLLGIEEYASDSLAGTGGLSSGELYYNTTSSSYVLKS